MTEENYKKILNEYKELKETQKKVQEADDKLYDLVEERAMLESNPMVQKYLQVTSAIKETRKIANQKVQTDEWFFDTIADSFYGNTDTNPIYVYMGRFANGTDSDIVHGCSKVRLPEVGLQNLGWVEYKNIEQHYAEATIEVQREEQAEFERQNLILYAPEKMEREEFYKLVRRTFFKYVVEFGQEEAVQKIIEEFKSAEEYQKLILGRFMKRD